jgi:hypothetical protein
MQENDVELKELILWGIYGGIAGGIIYSSILLLTNHLPIIASQMNVSGSISFGLLVNYLACMVLGVIYAVILFQFDSWSLIDFNNRGETIILGLMFGFLVYVFEEVTILTWIMGLPFDTAIKDLLLFDWNAWFELIGDFIFGIVLAMVVWSIHERYFDHLKDHTYRKWLN